MFWNKKFLQRHNFQDFIIHSFSQVTHFEEVRTKLKNICFKCPRPSRINFWWFHLLQDMFMTFAIISKIFTSSEIQCSTNIRLVVQEDKKKKKTQILPSAWFRVNVSLCEHLRKEKHKDILNQKALPPATGMDEGVLNPSA